MILYCDTSALVKLYFHESHSEEVIAQRGEAEALAISSVGFAEFFAALNRKQREGGLEARVHQLAAARFREEWLSLVRVEITEELNETIMRLLAAYPLRGFDAIHLASALILRERLKTAEIRFASFDERQRRAAEQESLTVVPRL
ncbi:type II toxin-antitoxin system VapC family toxin [Candidatus Fermentibacteria bacterium]|nr:type II toxin-antitoxin system VapC family toxin [Candidatus Fermentibacteria bacterium]